MQFSEDIGYPMQRNLFLYKGVDEEVVEELTRLIITINESDRYLVREYKAVKKNYIPEPIKLYISSHGGMVSPAIALVSIMLASDTPIHTIATGAAFSSALYILLAGEKRFAYTNTTVMIHEVSATPAGTSSILSSEIQDLKRLNKLYFDAIVESTKITKERLDKEIKERGNWYLTAQEAKRLGIIDHILTKI